MEAVPTPGSYGIRTSRRGRPSRERASRWTFGRDSDGDALTDFRPRTEEDEEVLRQRYTAGQGLDRIAEILDRRPGAVKKGAQCLGIKRPASLQRRRGDDLATASGSS